MAMNIFQLWVENEKITPFAVRRANWRSEFYTIVERVECDVMPYGKAYGFSVANGRYSDHYDYDKKWRDSGLIPGAGSYQWSLVRDADLTIVRPSISLSVTPSDTRVKTLESVLKFGKFKGYTVAQAFEQEPNYIIWLIENMEPFVIARTSLKALEDLGFFFPPLIKAINDRKLSLLDS